MTMLERAARALAPKAWAAMDTGDSLAQTNRRIASLRHVPAVLRAIREPDERVLLAMAILLMGERTASITDARAAALAIWQAGIDKITEDRG